MSSSAIANDSIGRVRNENSTETPKWQGLENWVGEHIEVLGSWVEGPLKNTLPLPHTLSYASFPFDYF